MELSAFSALFENIFDQNGFSAYADEKTVQKFHQLTEHRSRAP